MKLKIKGEHNFHFVAENPDESLNRYWKNKIGEAWTSEANEFLEEVAVALRKLKAGEKVTITSKPIVVVWKNQITNRPRTRIGANR